MSYEFRLGYLDGRVKSDLPAASAKRLSVSLRTTAGSSVTVRAGSTDADLLLEGDALLQIWEVNDNQAVDGDRVLLGHHRLISAEEVATDSSVTVAATFADPTWTLGRRLIGKSPTGFVAGTPLAPVDRGVIASNILAAVNAENVTGVRAGSVAPSAKTYVSGWTYKPVLEAIGELSATLDGPEWLVRPIPWSGGYYGEMDLGPALSTVRPNAVWEFGASGRSNVRGYRRIVTIEGTANQAYNLPPGWPDSATSPVVSASNGASIAARGLLEAVVSADLSVDQLRQELVNAHIVARRGPRQTITFEPVSDLPRAGQPRRVPRYGVDYLVGDIVPFRASIQVPNSSGAMETVRRLDVMTRAYGYDVTIDAAGAGTPSITVSPTT